MPAKQCCRCRAFVGESSKSTRNDDDDDDDYDFNDINVDDNDE